MTRKQDIDWSYLPFMVAEFCVDKVSDTLSSEIFLWEFPKSVKVKSITVSGKSVFITFKTREGEKYVEIICKSRKSLP